MSPHLGDVLETLLWRLKPSLLPSIFDHGQAPLALGLDATTVYRPRAVVILPFGLSETEKTRLSAGGPSSDRSEIRMTVPKEGDQVHGLKPGAEESVLDMGDLDARVNMPVLRCCDAGIYVLDGGERIGSRRLHPKSVGMAVRCSVWKGVLVLRQAQICGYLRVFLPPGLCCSSLCGACHTASSRLARNQKSLAATLASLDLTEH